MIDMDVVWNCTLIFGSRVLDVSLGTLRTLAMVRGAKLQAWALGFVEVLIWVLVAAHVLGSVQENWIYGVFYAMGFATGGYVGLTIEGRLALGERMVILFTRKGPDIAEVLRELNFIVTELEGKGRDGALNLLILKLSRKDLRKVIATARGIDTACFYIVESVDSTMSRRPTAVPQGGWRTIGRKLK